MKDISSEARRREYIQKNYKSYSNKELASQLGVSVNAVKKVAGRLGLKKDGAILNTGPNVYSQKQEDEDVSRQAPKAPRTGIEVRLDGTIIINWTKRTIITDLGEFGAYTCSFNTHGAIQRYYTSAYEGKGHTAAETAQKFSFAHAKAVHLYAKAHGFTKSSIPQTDIEFEEGLSPEEAAEETLQSLKRRAMALTERKKWEETQRDADSWNNFKHSVLYPMKDWVEENLPKYKAPRVNVGALKKKADPFAAVIGVSDWHYLKHAYDFTGKPEYNREIARAKLLEANQTLLGATLKIGVPDTFYIPIGTDNLHFDNLEHTTTRGTNQAGQADGNWRIDMEAYVDIVIGMIEYYAQISPVVAVPMPGNHDYQTSLMLHMLLKKVYAGNDRVKVINCYDPRVYLGYGKNAFMFTHGDSMSMNKLKRDAHKFFMAEAENQGLKMSRAEHFAMFSGHVHHDNFEDLGVVKHFIIPSLSPSDSWHKEAGFVGNRKEASIYLFDKEIGRRAIFYS
jgi:transposase